MNSKYLKLLACVGGCLLVGILGGLFTYPSIPTWYATLNKPFFTPPNWVFGPVWTTLYILMGIAIYLIWTEKKKANEKKEAINYFFAQLLCNFLWSVSFFSLQNPLMAVVIIFLLLGSLGMTIKMFYPINKNAAYLLVPYILWVSFASLLNIAVALLN